MKKEILGLGLGLLIASIPVAGLLADTIAAVLGVTGTIGTVYGFLAEEEGK
jgi:hypothetical protein